jgi:serine/threonine protein kinase
MVNGEPVTGPGHGWGTEPARRQLHPLGPDDPCRIGAYRILGLLAAGRKGRTYVGEALPGQVVVKRLDPSWIDAVGGRQALFRSLATARRLRPDDGVAAVFDARFDTPSGDGTYVVSEFVTGPTVRELVERAGSLPEEAVLEIAVTTIRALAAIHGTGLAHGDVHPSSVVVGPGGPKLVDAGLLPVRSDRSVSRSGVGDGPPVPGRSTWAQQTDLTAWAAMLAYAAAGRPSLLDLARRPGTPRPRTASPRARDVLEALPNPLPRIVYACLVPAPSRCPSAQQVLDQLSPGTVPSQPLTAELPLLVQASPSAGAPTATKGPSTRQAAPPHDREPADRLRPAPVRPLPSLPPAPSIPSALRGSEAQPESAPPAEGQPARRRPWAGPRGVVARLVRLALTRSGTRRSRAGRG